MLEMEIININSLVLSISYRVWSVSHPDQTNVIYRQCCVTIKVFAILVNYPYPFPLISPTLGNSGGMQRHGRHGTGAKPAARRQCLPQPSLGIPPPSRNETWLWNPRKKWSLMVISSENHLEIEVLVVNLGRLVFNPLVFSYQWDYLTSNTKKGNGGYPRLAMNRGCNGNII